MKTENKELGKAGIIVTLSKGIITVRHIEGPVLFTREAKEGDWKKLFKGLKG